MVTGHGTYIGSCLQLKGKTALLQIFTLYSNVKAQFDDTQTGYGFGWYEFPKEDFSIDPDPFAEENKNESLRSATGT